MFISDKWKKVRIIFLHKKVSYIGWKLENYQPISRLLSMSKILEKYVKNCHPSCFGQRIAKEQHELQKHSAITN